MCENLISIIVPVYNTENYLGKCLKSIIMQTYKKIEIIVVDDGSEGNVEEIVRKANDNRIRIIKHEKNMGLFAARLSGIKEATGEYLSFVDSDDTLEVDYYRLLIKSAMKYNTEIIIASTVVVYENGDRSVQNLHKNMFDFDKIEGDLVQQRYFGQSGICYSWHNVWNKLYKRCLLERCIKYFKCITEHIVMAEDILFSTIFFYSAKSISTSKNSIYFYNRNNQSSTIDLNKDEEKLFKNVKDICYVFNYLNKVFENENIDIYNSFVMFNARYKKIWTDIIKNFNSVKEKQLIKFLEDSLLGEKKITDDKLFYFCSSFYNEGLEQIKLKLINTKCNIISFDIFDTLILRPFFYPNDLFYMLDKLFEKLMNCNISFYKIRVEGENAARNYYSSLNSNWQDITLNEIYDYISAHYNISKPICQLLKSEEEILEIRFSDVRKIGKELFELAIYLGKTVILTSDMYLPLNVIERILRKHEITKYNNIYLSSEYRKVKSTGDLYDEIVKKEKINFCDLLHIGDNLFSDIEVCMNKGIDCIYIPKAIDSFLKRNILYPYEPDSSGGITYWCGLSINKQKIYESLGFRCMINMVANKYFDNPFESFNYFTEFNSDPSFIGYYAVGMHLISINKWILNIVQTKNYKRVLFTSRDGYLFMKSFQEYLRIFNIKGVETKYLYVSRKALMPQIVVGKNDLYDLPISPTKYSPIDILNLLGFCLKDFSENEIKKILKNNNINYIDKFNNIEKYTEFIELFINNFYDEGKHKKAQLIIKKYFKFINEEDVVFDMGYSGRIHKAICDATEKKLGALFIHSDSEKIGIMSRRGDFSTDTFYDYTPQMCDLEREILLSALEPACIGYQEIKKDLIIPIFEKDKTEIQNKVIIGTIQKNALQFVKKFYENFFEYYDYISFKNHEISIPFEGFLRASTKIDREVFKDLTSDDLVYNNNSNIYINEFIENELNSNRDIESPSCVNGRFIHSLRILTQYKNKIVIWGTGKIATDIVEKYYFLPVQFFLDNNINKNRNKFVGKNIYCLNEIDNIENYFIIVCVNHTNFREIEKQLIDLKLVRYIHYIFIGDIFLCF